MERTNQPGIGGPGGDAPHAPEHPVLPSAQVFTVPPGHLAQDQQRALELRRQGYCCLRLCVLFWRLLVAGPVFDQSESGKLQASRIKRGRKGAGPANPPNITISASNPSKPAAPTTDAIWSMRPRYFANDICQLYVWHPNVIKSSSPQGQLDLSAFCAALAPSWSTTTALVH